MPVDKQPGPADLITIAEAARLLAVSLPTLRRWDSSGKFPARRHQMNGYRMYAKDDVMRLRKKIVQADWGDPRMSGEDGRTSPRRC
jgi:excisionase family DNA binding protein